jgi:NAD+ kinase
MTAPSVGFLLHPREDTAILSDALAVVEALEMATWIASQDAELVLRERLEGCRLLVTVGGDGTFLLGARHAGLRGVPVLGANRGQLGFLTEIDVGSLPNALRAFFAGQTLSQRRSFLELRVPSDGEEQCSTLVSAHALNEVVVKSVGTNLARLRVDADDELLGEFDADGVIVATATGSTAYALSAGGPPVDPRVRAVIVVPLAPFAVLTRAVVLPEMTSLRVTLVHGRAYAAADGYLEITLHEGNCVSVDPGPELEVVRIPGSPSFLRRLREKMRLGTPLKPLGGDSSIAQPSAGPVPFAASPPAGTGSGG